MPGPSPTARIARLAMAGTALVIALALALPPCPPALAAGVPIVVAGEAQEARAGAPLSSYIDTSARPAFEDRFATFDHGTDQAPRCSRIAGAPSMAMAARSPWRTGTCHRPASDRTRRSRG
ncbi:hypothetical protein ACFSTD_15185 [Novosphingobium colocasiae]